MKTLLAVFGMDTRGCGNKSGLIQIQTTGQGSSESRLC